MTPTCSRADVDVFATDRVTGLAVNDKNLPPEATPHDGLVNKFPFDVEKKSYPFWDGTVGRAVNVVYDGTVTLDGIETYKFPNTVEDEPIDVAEGVPGTYTNVTVYVEPMTGSIIDRPGPAEVPRRRHDGARHAARIHRSTRQGRRDEAMANGQRCSSATVLRSSASSVVACACSGLRPAARTAWWGRGPAGAVKAARPRQRRLAPSPRRRSRCPG